MSQLARSVLALLASALILLVGFIVYSESRVPDGANREHPRNIPGQEFQAVFGQAEAAGGALVFHTFEPRGHEFHAIAVWRGSLQAANYPILSYRLHAADPGPTMRLIWRTAADPRGINSMVLDRAASGTTIRALARDPRWRGTITEIGFYAIGPSADTPLALAGVTLQPHGWRGEIASYWASWLAHRGWTQRSINFLFGTPTPQGVSPNLVAAAWSALAALLLLVVALVRRSGNGVALVAVVLVPWLALDLLWQRELNGQLQQTRERFAGKDIHARHLVDEDSHIYSYVSRLKSTVLSGKRARILLLHDSTKHSFDRLRTQYYLLPHNVYNLGRTPPKAGVENVDYILVLGDISRIEMRDGGATLAWKRGRKSVPVELVDSDPLGKLYRILSESIERGEG